MHLAKLRDQSKFCCTAKTAPIRNCICVNQSPAQRHFLCMLAALKTRFPDKVFCPADIPTWPWFRANHWTEFLRDQILLIIGDQVLRIPEFGQLLSDPYCPCTWENWWGSRPSRNIDLKKNPLCSGSSPYDIAIGFNPRVSFHTEFEVAVPHPARNSHPY